jgi:NADH dehydrogenase
MLPRVVIVGGGFGGLAAARALRNTPVSVTLIDKRNYHLFRPMLYQVATGLLSADEISGPLRSIFSHKKTLMCSWTKSPASTQNNASSI